MKILRSFGKPEYLFRPLQVLRRLGREFRHVPERASVALPWGLDIQVRPHETIGSCVWRTGIYDLCTSECLWRLLDPGETALDVGANIGHMTGLMAHRLGPRGKVIAFEPHPELFAELQGNVFRWRKFSDLGAIELMQAGVSSESGAGMLHIPKGFRNNRGLASLNQPIEDGFHNVSVELIRLDDLLVDAVIGVMKIDVEGHELSVLEGAERLIRERKIRDIIFEEHNELPTPVTDCLEDCGYTVFSLDNTVIRPLAASVGKGRKNARRDAPNYLATAAPERAQQRLAKIGWRVLRNRRVRQAAIA
jgi:FkbM family methyltransferase